MMRKLFAIACSAMLAAICLIGAAKAQTGPAGPAGPGSPATPAIQPALPDGVLTEQSLEAALKALDPNYKVRPTSDGLGKVFNLKGVRDGWTYLLQIESFKNEIWLNAELSGVLSAPQNVSSSVMAELFKTNFKIGPTHFAFNQMSDNSGAKLFLCRFLDRRMTIENFNGHVIGFLKTVQETYPTWSQVR